MLFLPLAFPIPKMTSRCTGLKEIHLKTSVSSINLTKKGARRNPRC